MRVCARVLAAALMTGSIAFALSFPAVLGQRRDEPRAIVAPPSAELRTVHVTAGATPARHQHHRNGAAAAARHRPSAQPGGSGLASVRLGQAARQGLAADSAGKGPVAQPRTAPRPPIARPVAPGPAGPAVAPVPAPAPTPAPAPSPPPAPAQPAPTRELAQAAPPPVAPAPPVAETPPPAPAADDEGCDDENDDGAGDGHGHAYGHDKHDGAAAGADSSHGHGHDGEHGGDGHDHDGQHGNGGHDRDDDEDD